MMTSLEPESGLRIGTLAERTGTTPPTIRYYEEIGLIARAARERGGQRRYGADDVRRLNFIRGCRDVGLPVAQVRALVGLLDDPSRSCTEARDIGQAHLDAIRAKLADLRALERTMVAFVERCDSACHGGPSSACVPLLTLPAAMREQRAR